MVTPLPFFVIDAITLAAQGKATAQELVAKFNTKPNFSVAAMEVDEKEGKMITQEALEDILCLLREERLDTEMLAMESLRNLTDAEKSGELIAREASIQLLKDFDSNGTGGVHDEGDANTGSMIYDCLSRCLQADKRSEGDKRRFDFEENHINNMKYLSLQVLGNAMLYLRHENYSVENEHVLCLIPIMIEEMKHADEHPHGAYFATRCLDSVLKYYPYSIADRGNLSAKLGPLLMSARSVGACGHACLEDVTNRVLDRLHVC